MVLAMILGFMVETSLRRSLVISYGKHLLLLHPSIALALIVLALITLIFPIIRRSGGSEGKQEYPPAV